MNTEEKNLLYEVNFFLEKLTSFEFNDECILIYNDSNKSKVINAHFVVKFKNKFSLKVLKKYGLYHFTFFNCDIDYEDFNSFLNRDCFFDFFNILCKLNIDLKPSVEDYYPKDFESTEYFMKYYECFDDKKKVRHYGLKIDEAIEFIKENYNFIGKVVGVRCQ